MKNMEIDEILEEIDSLTETQELKDWHNLALAPSKDSHIQKLRDLAKRIGKNHSLALKLWETKIEYAMLLAIFIEEPEKITKEQLESQIHDITKTNIADKFCSYLVAKTSFSTEFIQRWKESDNEVIKRSTFTLITEVSKKEKALSNSYFEQFLPAIKDSIHQEKVAVKESMLYALNAIGSRNEYLKGKARDVVEKLGNVLVGDPNSVCNVATSLENLKNYKLKMKKH